MKAWNNVPKIDLLIQFNPAKNCSLTEMTVFK